MIMGCIQYRTLKKNNRIPQYLQQFGNTLARIEFAFVRWVILSNRKYLF